MKKKKINLRKPVTLKGLRESVELTQKQVADLTKISQPLLSQYEKGDRQPTLAKACALAREYGVSLKTLAKTMNLDVTGIPDKDNISN